MTVSSRPGSPATHIVLRFNSIQAVAGVGQELTFIVAAVIGGCLLTGGFGSVVGASIGALIFGMTSAGIVYANWDSDWFRFFLGVMLLVAVLANLLPYAGWGVRARRDGMTQEPNCSNSAAMSKVLRQRHLPQGHLHQRPRGRGHLRPRRQRRRQVHPHQDPVRASTDPTRAAAPRRRPHHVHQPPSGPDAGIATVFQDLAMIPLMSVWRNFFLGAEPRKGWGPTRRLDSHQAHRDRPH